MTKNIFFTFLIAAFYLALTSYILNYKLFLSTVLGNFPINYKAAILFNLPLGLKSALSSFDFYLLLLTSLLLGINLILIVKTIRLITIGSPRIKFLFGGSSMLAVVSAGCTTCGLSLLSILGFGASISLLPFGGKFIYLISIGLLILSIVYMLKKIEYAKSCEVKI